MHLCTGGGSALLPAPAPPMSLQEKQDVTRKLAAAGATIQELNTVRRALSLLKGGGLAQCANPAKVTQLHNQKIGVHSQIPELGLCEAKRRKKNVTKKDKCPHTDLQLSKMY